jgi:hypothetical protein
MSLTTRNWHRHPLAKHTWINFKAAFKITHLDLRLGTTSMAGFQGRAHHSEEVDPLPSKVDTANNTTHAFLANLANAAIKINKQMTALGVTVAALKVQVETANTALAASQAAQSRGNNHCPQTNPTTMQAHRNNVCQSTVGPMVAVLAEHTLAKPALTKTQVTKGPPPTPTT